VQELRPKSRDSEKITINLGYVDLGHIDLLVREGFYSNPRNWRGVRQMEDLPGPALCAGTKEGWCLRGLLLIRRKVGTA
jgi:Ribbon-Helix-Helix transcriptional regulator family